MRIRLTPGVWVGSLGLIFGGIFAVLSANVSQTALLWAGWLSVAAGVILAAWGVTIDGKHWWKRRWLPRLSIGGSGTLYVGQISISETKLVSEHYLELVIRGHNGTAKGLRLAGVSGFIGIDFSRDGKLLEGFNFAPLALVSGDGICPPGGEFFLVFRQSFTPQQVSQYQDRRNESATARFLFERLLISMANGWGKVLPLPLWDGVTIANGLVIGRIHKIAAHSAVHASASLG